MNSIKVKKIRFYPNKKQMDIIDKNLKGCHFIWNLCNQFQREEYAKHKRFIHWNEMSKIVNKYRDEEALWLKEISSKAIKNVVTNHYLSYINFFNNIGFIPRFKSWKRNPTKSFFFIKDGVRYIEPKKIMKIPILGKIRIRERGYMIPEELITSGRVLKEYGRYWILLVYKKGPVPKPNPNSLGIGIDLGISKYATIYREDGWITEIKSFLNDFSYRKYHEKIIKLQQVISHKSEINLKKMLTEFDIKYHRNPTVLELKIMKGGSYNTSNIRKLRNKLSNLRFKLKNYVMDWINKRVNTIVTRIKPLFISIENLSIKSMLENDSSKKLHDKIAKSNFYKFSAQLIQKSIEYGIEVRQANKYFASSKKCSRCGNMNTNLKLSDRKYNCTECGITIDRDLNAAINLCNLTKYKIMI